MADSPFILPIASERYVKPTAPDTSEDKKIFNKYKKGTLDKLEASYEELMGRYGKDLSGTGEDVQAYEKARPSINWRVNKDFVKSPLSEQKVDVFLKVGISKQIVGSETLKDGSTRPLKEITLTTQQAGSWFADQITMIGALEKDTEAGQAFHSIAIDEAYPPSTAWVVVDGENVEGIWEHNEDTDRYEAVLKAASDDVEE